MITVIKNNRVISQTSSIEFSQSLTSKGISTCHDIVVLGPVLASLRVVGMISRNTHLGRIKHFLMWTNPDLTFMTDRRIENRKKRLSLLPITIMRLV